MNHIEKPEGGTWPKTQKKPNTLQLRVRPWRGAEDYVKKTRTRPCARSDPARMRSWLSATRLAGKWKIDGKHFRRQPDGRVGIVLRVWPHKKVDGELWLWDLCSEHFLTLMWEDGSSMCSRSELREPGGCFFQFTSCLVEFGFKILYFCGYSIVGIIYTVYWRWVDSGQVYIQGFAVETWVQQGDYHNWWVGIPHATTTLMHIGTRIR